MHFYNQFGEPCHTYINKTGKECKTGIVRARKEKLVPSVTTVMSVNTEEALINYQIEQVIDAAWAHPYTSGKDFKMWKNEIRQLSRKKKDKAAKDGNRIHSALESYYKGEWEQECTATDLDIDIVAKVSNFLWLEFGNLKWHSEKTFIIPHGGGYGGSVDLYFSGDYEEYLEEGINEVAEEYSIIQKRCKIKPIIIDFKTQATSDVNNFKYYKKYCMQLAAYRVGLGLPKADCYNLKISTTAPGVIELKKWDESELETSFRAFCYLLKYWYLINMPNKES